MTFEIHLFQHLSLEDFHDIIALRTEIFVVEQNCPYLELDGNDKNVFHVIGRDENGKIVTTARIFPPKNGESKIGRVVVAKSHRGTGLGHTLMKTATDFCFNELKATKIRISAQKHLEKFYNQHGFQSTGKEYLEDGIPHVEMVTQ